MGFVEVYDYVTGKQNWLASGLPVEGTNADMARAGGVARKDAPTCRLDEPLGDVQQRVEAAGWDVCVVVNEDRVVLGFLREKHFGGDPHQTVERVMSPGPSTFRPHVTAAELGEYLIRHDLPSVPITTGDGVLVGVLLRDDAARYQHEEHGHDE